MSEKRILIVETNHAQGRLVYRGFQDRGYYTDFTTDPETGLAMVSLNEPYDVLIVNEYMGSGWTGLQFIEAVRKQTKSTPKFLLYTGFFRDQIIGEIPGDVIYVWKGDTLFKKLLQIVEELLDNKK